jgi:hypothetical protein
MLVKGFPDGQIWWWFFTEHATAKREGSFAICRRQKNIEAGRSSKRLAT